MGPEVSIVVPCFNCERFVEEAISSALAQDCDLEVIVVDDGSTDASAAILKSIAERDERLSLHRTDNCGISHARNLGFRTISPASRYVLFLDADDVLVPGALSVLQSRLDRDPALCAVLGSRSRIDMTGAVVESPPTSIPFYCAEDRGVRRVETPDRVGYWHLLPICPISTPGQCLIRVSALGRDIVFDERYSPCEDWELWLRLARGAPIGVEHREVLSYRDHDANVSKKYSLMYEQRATVYDGQAQLLASGDIARFRAAWRFGMYVFDARLCGEWARDRLAARDFAGAGRYLLRWVRYEAQRLWAGVRGKPDVSALRARPKSRP